MKIAKFLAGVVFCVAISGCGPKIKTEDVTPPPATVRAKAVLDDIATSGEPTSGIMDVEAVVAEIKTQDAAKGETLQKSFDELKNANDPETRKAKAKAMAAQL